MQQICANLIVRDNKLNILRFVQVSFQEFLQAHADFTSQSRHREAAVSCLESSLQGAPQDKGRRRSLAPGSYFNQYSVIFWADHCNRSGTDGKSELMISKLHKFVFDERNVSLYLLDWLESVGKFQE